jgi:hypothetical protein
MTADYKPKRKAPSSTNGTRQLVGWFALLVLIGPIHMGEQLMSGLDTLYELQALMAGYYSLFANPDVATVLLVIFFVTLVQSMLLAVLAGGRWRLLVAGFFGFMGLLEVHHLMQTLIQAEYFPGVVTSIAYSWIGAMVLRAVIREWRGTTPRVQEYLAAV